MESTVTFEILIQKKIPLLRNFLSTMMVLCFLVFVIGYFTMLPAKFATSEMKIAYIDIVFPAWLLKMHLYALAAFFTCMFLYGRVKFFESAEVTLTRNGIRIVGRDIDRFFKNRLIKDISCHDLHNFLRQPKDKMQIVLKDIDHRSFSFRLKHYSEVDEFMETAIRNFENVNVYVHEDERHEDFEGND